MRSRCGPRRAGERALAPLGSAVPYCHRSDTQRALHPRVHALHACARSMAPALRRVPVRAMRAYVRPSAGGARAHCARHCAQGSLSARTTPTTARRARRRSPPSGRAPLQPAPEACPTSMACPASFGYFLPPLPRAAAGSPAALAASSTTCTRRAHLYRPTSRCAPVRR